jgi:hypothetical protein
MPSGPNTRKDNLLLFFYCLFNDAINTETIRYNIDGKVKLNVEQLVELAGKPKFSEMTHSNVTLSTTNPTSTDLGSKTKHRNGMATINHFS